MLIPTTNPDKKIYINSIVLVVIVLAIIIIAPIKSSFNKIQANKRISCKDFSTQKEAQKAYDSDPIKYKSLDSGQDDDNSDGDSHGLGEVACESLKLK